VDPGDLASGRQITARRLLVQLGQQGGCRKCPAEKELSDISRL